MYNKIKQRKHIIIIACMICLAINVPSRAKAQSTEIMAGITAGTTLNTTSVTEEKTQELAPKLQSSEIFMMEGSTTIIGFDDLHTDSVVTYNVSDITIVSVTKSGQITAIGAGEAKVSIFILQAGKSYKLSLTINILKSTDTQLLLKETEVTLGQGETWKSWTRLVPSETGDTVSYTSDNSTIAQVDNTGKITAVNIGTTVIKASFTNGNYVTCTMTVKRAPVSILVPFTTKTLKKGSKLTLKSTITSGYSSSKLNYASDNENVATVDQNGIIKAVKSGTTKIIVSAYNGKRAAVVIRVADQIGTFHFLYLSGKSITLAKDQSRTLSCSVSPSNISNYVKSHMVWASDNTKVATVDNNGTIKAVKDGKAKITLATSDGSAYKISITVKVVARKNGTSYYQDKMSIVDTSKAKYTYKEMAGDLKSLEKIYGDCIKVSILATSYDKRSIYQVVLGNPKATKKIMIQSAIHGREYMTSQLTMRQIEFYCRNYYTGVYEGKYFSELFDEVAFYIVPMANPDGVTISQFGAGGIRNLKLRSKIIALCEKYGKGKKSFYTRWKANARGVNLNRNFDAYWGLSKKNAPSFPYKGKSAVSELESKALVKLFTKIKPAATLSYHATGSIIFWDYGQEDTLRTQSFEIAKTLKAITKYSTVKGFDKYLSGGFSDWVSIKNDTPAITIEIGKKDCPLKTKEFKSIWTKNRMLLAAYAKMFS